MRLALLAVLLFSQLATAQVVFTGPKESPPGKVCKIGVSDIKCTLIAFKNGEPTDDFSQLKTWDDKPLIYLEPAEPAKYLFVASSVVEGKATLSFHTVTVKLATPPTPPVPPDALTAALKLAYSANPNPDGAKALADIYEAAAKLDTSAAASTFLRAECSAKLQPSTLRAVRDLVQKELDKPTDYKTLLPRVAAILRTL